MLPVTAAPLIVAVAIAEPAPLDVAAAGASFTTAFPLESVSAELGLKVPRPEAEVKVTT